MVIVSDTLPDVAANTSPVVCRECGEVLVEASVSELRARSVRTVSGWQHAALPRAGVDRGHDPNPVHADQIPPGEQLATLADQLRALPGVAHPADRDRLAVALREQLGPLLWEIRHLAAVEATEQMGLSQTAYGEMIGASQPIVADLIRRKKRSRTGRTPRGEA